MQHKEDNKRKPVIFFLCVCAPFEKGLLEKCGSLFLSTCLFTGQEQRMQPRVDGRHPLRKDNGADGEYFHR